MYTPSYRDFLALSRHFNLIPVFTEKLEDTQTPISIYLKMKTAIKGPSFLLESIEENQHSGRYSFIGLDPFIIYRSKNCCGQLISGNGEKRPLNGPPTRAISSLLRQYNVPPVPGTAHFYGGAAGYFAYDIIRSLEKLPPGPPGTLNLPDCLVMFPGTIIVFDHLRKVTKIITLAETANPSKAYQRALQRIDEIKGIINTLRLIRTASKPAKIVPGAIKTNISREKYFKQVEKALNYIKSGDILQVVLSRRYSLPFEDNPLDVFRLLRSSNPSPYMFYLDFGDPVILGTSPEMLVRVTGKTVQTRPIAGTRPRSRDPVRDKEMENDLLRDEKERAEHLMLVDLGRNDLGRVCIPGSVEVPSFMRVERFSHVMHLVSDVKGELAPGTHPLQALEACFPAGTVSGAPKIRAMEIIDELEPCRREIYAGAVGYAGFGNLLDTAIAIRTLVISRGTAHIQAGGGIVADSIPEKEYLETVNKAGALLEALGIDRDREAAHGIND